MSLQTLAAEPSKQAPAPLEFEFAIPLNDFPANMAWSPDGRELAVTQFNRGKVLFIDVANRRLTEREIAANNPEMAWSPDGKYLAFNEGSIFINGIRVFSTETWKEVGRKDRLGGECIFQLSDSSFGFTADSKIIWASCRQGPFTDRYIIALKLSVPDLRVLDMPERRLEQPVVNGHVAGAYVVPCNDGLDLNSIISSRTSEKDKLGYPIIRYSAVLATLNAQAVLGPVLPLEINPDYARYLKRVIQWPERNRLVAFWNWAERPLVANPSVDKVSLPRIETYDLQTGQRLLAFGSQTEHRIPLHDVVLARKAAKLIGALSSLNPMAGGLVVWDPDTGLEVQRLATKFSASWVRLSPDESRLAAIVLNEVHFFKVAQ